jgi:hypothetical protein
MKHARKSAPRAPSKGYKVKLGNRKPKGPKVTRTRLRKAIKGSNGILKRVAHRLGVTRRCVSYHLRREENEDLREIMQEERDTLVDDSEDAVRYVITQREDLRTCASTARWVLDRRSPKFKPRSEVTIEGGKEPLKVQTTHVDVDSLPLEVRLQILEALDQKQTTEPTKQRYRIYKR